MISVTHFAASEPDFPARARAALDVLAQRPGYLRGTLARSTDEVDAWLLVTEWQNVGSYRRALGSFDVKLHANTLLGEAIDMPSSFEPLVDVAPGGTATVSDSDHA